MQFQGKEPGTVLTQKTIIADENTMKNLMQNLPQQLQNMKSGSQSVVIKDAESQQKIQNFISQVGNASQAPAEMLKKAESFVVDDSKLQNLLSSDNGQGSVSSTRTNQYMSGDQLQDILNKLKN